jgi:hypothetical protein
MDGDRVCRLPNMPTVPEFVLAGRAQYVSTEERFATLPSLAVRNFMRMTVCLKSIH